jgi:hypothetical protein
VRSSVRVFGVWAEPLAASLASLLAPVLAEV